MSNNGRNKTKDAIISIVFGIIGLVGSISDGGFKLKYLPILLFPLVGIGAIAGGITRYVVMYIQTGISIQWALNMNCT